MDDAIPMEEGLDDGNAFPAREVAPFAQGVQQQVAHPEDEEDLEENYIKYDWKFKILSWLNNNKTYLKFFHFNVLADMISPLNFVLQLCINFVFKAQFKLRMMQFLWKKGLMMEMHSQPEKLLHLRKDFNSKWPTQKMKKILSKTISSMIEILCSQTNNKKTYLKMFIFMFLLTCFHR